MAGENDRPLGEVEIPAAIVSKLGKLAIHGVRQFHARLRQEGPTLRQYLQLSDAAFSDLCRQVEEVIRSQYPLDLSPPAHLEVHKKGVAVHRLRDPKRPKFRPSKGD